MFKTILLIGLSGGIGSILRFSATTLVTKYFKTLFPLATFSVNILGCLLIGLIIGMCEQKQIISHNMKIILISGFCGSFTTFSAFAHENIYMIQNHNIILAIIYIISSILLGLLAVWAGMRFANLF